MGGRSRRSRSHGKGRRHLLSILSIVHTLEHRLGLDHIASGKVREIYAVDAERLLIVATDRISAFDVVLDQPIPDKGKVLTALSQHWFDLLDTPHHLISTDPASVPGLSAPDAVAGRMMLVHRAEVIPMECVVRGYLYGSSWQEYAGGGGPTTEHLPPGLEQASRLTEPIFTPATKAESGHDMNLTEAEARRHVGDHIYEELRKRSVDLYRRGAGARRVVRYPARRHQVRVRHRGWQDRAHRRGPHP